MKLQLFCEFSTLILKKWILWIFLGVDVIALPLTYRLLPSQPPQFVYWAIAFIGFFIACLQVYKEIIQASLDLEQVGEKISILKTFLNNPSSRTVSGLARDTGIDENTVRRKLLELEIVGMANKVSKKNGTRWSITTKGRGFLEKLRTISNQV